MTTTTSLGDYAALTVSVIGNDEALIQSYLEKGDELFTDSVELNDEECFAMAVVLDAVQKLVRPAITAFCHKTFMDWPQSNQRTKIAACLIFNDIITPHAVRVGLLAPL